MTTLLTGTCNHTVLQTSSDTALNDRLLCFVPISCQCMRVNCGTSWLHAA